MSWAFADVAETVETGWKFKNIFDRAIFLCPYIMKISCFYK